MSIEIAATIAGADIAGPLARDASSISLVTDITDEFLAEWEKLLSQHRRPGNAFHQPTIIANALQGTRDRTTVFAVIRRDGAIVSILPLHLARQFGVMIASDIVAPVSQYNDVIGHLLGADDVRRVAANLRSAFGIDALLLRRIRDDSGLTCALQDFAPTSLTTTSAAPFIDLAACGTFEAYIERFGKKTMRMRRQRRHKLEQLHGPLSFSVFTGPNGQSALSTALRWKREWLIERGLSSAVFDGGRNESLLRRICSGNDVRITVLNAGRRPVAIEVGIVHGANYVAYLGAFDPEFTRFSPGQEQMLRTLAWCFGEGIERYDLLAPDDDYKMLWTDAKVAVHDYCVALSPAGAGYALLRRLGHSRMQSVLRTLPNQAKRYGPAALGVGATAAAIGILAD